MHSGDRAAFTVIELLVVIGVLAVLLAILLPVFRNAHAATLRTRARIQATALAQAVVQYKNVYGYWPGMVEESGNQVKRNEEAFENPSINWPLVSKFSNEWFTVTSSTGSEANYVTDNILYRSLLPFHKGDDAKNLNPLNPNRIHFLDLHGEQTPETVSLPDPWGHQYIVVMGLNPAGTFSQEFRKNSVSGALIQRLSVSNMTAFVICLGANGSNSTNLIFSAGVSQ